MMTKDNIESWLELESDPGLFSLLVEDFGAKGIEVEEIYELNNSFTNQLVHGFIFLFKWVEDKRSRRKIENALETSYLMDHQKINSMFFAKQIVPNSCATHALLSIILNCPDIMIGKCLEKLKNDTYLYTPENKGYAIAGMVELAQAHNKHAKRDKHHLSHHHAKIMLPTITTSSHSTQLSSNCHLEKDFSTDNKSILSPLPNHSSPTPLPTITVTKSINVITQPQVHHQPYNPAPYVSGINLNSEDDSFHYVSFVPIHGTLYELDGLKPYPINHGSWEENESWTDKVRMILFERIGASSNPSLDSSREIRFNLLAVVADKRIKMKKKLIARKSELSSALESLPQILKTFNLKTYETLFKCSRADDNFSSDIIGSFSEEISFFLQKQVLMKSQESLESETVIKTEEHYEFAIIVRIGKFGADSQSAKLISEVIPERVKRKLFEIMHHREKRSRKIGQDCISQMCGSSVESHTNTEDNDIKFHLSDYIEFLKTLNREMMLHEESLSKENEKWDRYRVDDARRTHDYTEFINTFLTMLAQNKLIGNLVESNLTGSVYIIQNI